MNDYNFSKAVFIGAGKIASSLLPAVNRAGMEVIQVISSSLNSAKELAERNNVFNYSDDISALSNEADIIFLSVPDSQIKPAAEKTAQLDISFNGKLFIHFSGARDINELEVLKLKAAKTASIHIMKSFPGKSEIDIEGSHAAIETDDKGIYNFLFDLCKNMQLKLFPIRSEAKVYYHMMGVFALNFMSANFYNSDKLRKRGSGEIPEAKELLVNAAFDMLKNIEQKGAVEALSGPVERGDLSTIKRHVESIRDDELLLFNYLTSSLTLIDVAKEKQSITGEHYTEMKNYLENELKLVCRNYLNT